MYCQCGCKKITSICDRNDKKRGYVKGKYQKFLSGHNCLKRNIDKSYYKVLENGCWEWLGPIAKNGYGYIQRNHTKSTAHRMMYLQEKGFVPRGFVVDHICHNNNPSCKKGNSCLHRKCVNPNH